MGDQTEEPQDQTKDAVPALADGERAFWRSILSTERKRFLPAPASLYPWQPLALIAALTFLYFLL